MRVHLIVATERLVFCFKYQLHLIDLQIVVGASLLAVLGYFGFSVWVFGWTADAALRGDVVGTWKSFATLAFGFWLGSSSAGKAKDGEPAPVAVVNGPDAPVPVETQP